jgi:hypothetical protein
MQPDAILLAADGVHGWGTYQFVCPTCAIPVEKRADKKIVDLLRSVGVRHVSEEPAYLGGGQVVPSRSAPELIDAPPLTYDDLLAFHFQLEDDPALAGWLQMASEVIGPEGPSGT